MKGKRVIKKKRKDSEEKLRGGGERKRQEGRRGGKRRGRFGSREEGRVWENIGSVANPTLSHKGNRPCLVVLGLLTGPDFPTVG